MLLKSWLACKFSHSVLQVDTGSRNDHWSLSEMVRTMVLLVVDATLERANKPRSLMS